MIKIVLLLLLVAILVARIECGSDQDEEDGVPGLVTDKDGLMDLETFKELYFTSTESTPRKVDITQIRNPKSMPGGRYMLTSLEIRNESLISGFQVVSVEYGVLSFEFWSFQDCGQYAETCADYLAFKRFNRFSIYDYMAYTGNYTFRVEPGLNILELEAPIRILAGTMVVFTQETRLVLVDTTGDRHSSDYLIGYTRKTSDDLSMYPISKYRNSNHRFFIDLMSLPSSDEEASLVKVDTLIGNTSPLAGLPEVRHQHLNADEYLDSPQSVLKYEKYILTSFNFSRPSYLKEVELLAASKGPVRIQFLSIAFHDDINPENVAAVSSWTQHLNRTRKRANQIEIMKLVGELNLYIDSVGHNVFRFHTPVLINANTLPLLEHYSGGRVALDVSSRAANFPSDYLFIDQANAIRLDSKHNQQFYINFKIMHYDQRLMTTTSARKAVAVPRAQTSKASKDLQGIKSSGQRSVLRPSSSFIQIFTFLFLFLAQLVF